MSSTHRMRIILDAKYEKAELNKVMAEHCKHLRPKEQEIILHLLRNFEDIFNGTLGTWTTTPVHLELKDDATP